MNKTDLKKLSSIINRTENLKETMILKKKSMTECKDYINSSIIDNLELPLTIDDLKRMEAILPEVDVDYVDRTLIINNNDVKLVINKDVTMLAEVELKEAKKYLEKGFDWQNKDLKEYLNEIVKYQSVMNIPLDEPNKDFYLKYNPEKAEEVKDFCIRIINEKKEFSALDYFEWEDRKIDLEITIQQCNNILAAPEKFMHPISENEFIEIEKAVNKVTSYYAIKENNRIAFNDELSSSGEYKSFPRSALMEFENADSFER